MAINIVVGENSWVTLTEANDYLESRIGASDWLSLTSDQQKKLIISAFRWIYFSGKFSIAKTADSENVKNAQIEAAWWMNNYFEELEKRQAMQAGGVTSFKLSKWEEDYSGKTDFPETVKGLLEDFETSGNYFPKIQRAND
jgi:hypothetical protein